MICASCGEATTETPCTACGRDPLLEGRYRLEAILGQGAVGTTYRATRLSDGHVVAIKEMLLRRAETDKARELMAREIGLLRQLSHPGIPDHVEDFVAGSGKHRALYLAQDFIDGEPLSETLASKRFDEPEVIEILGGLLDILGYLHQLRPPVIHRDLKPANVMRRPDGSLVLIDFGAARDAVKDPDLGGSTVAGTFGYMAPEQFQGDATPATDLYALGVVATALLTRQEPRAMLDGATLDAWLEAAHVSAPLRRFLRTLTAEQPGDRPQSAQEARRLLRRLSEPPPQPKPKPKPKPITTAAAYAPVPPQPFAATAAEDEDPMTGRTVQLALLVLAGVLLLWWLASSPPAPAPAPTATAAPPPAACKGGPCVPVGEGQLKGVQLGMTRAEADEAFPQLVEAHELGPERIHAPIDIMDINGALSTIQHAAEVPGPHLEVRTTLLEQPATCLFQLAVEERVSQMHCALQAPSTRARNDQLVNQLRDLLADRYGSPDTSEEPRDDMLVGMGVSEHTYRWADETGTLLLHAKGSYFTGIPSSGEIEVTFTSAAHAQLARDLEAEASRQLQAAREQQRREEQEQLRKLQQESAGSDDL